MWKKSDQKTCFGVYLMLIRFFLFWVLAPAPLQSEVGRFRMPFKEKRKKKRKAKSSTGSSTTVQSESSSSSSSSSSSAASDGEWERMEPAEKKCKAAYLTAEEKIMALERLEKLCKPLRTRSSKAEVRSAEDVHASEFTECSRSCTTIC